MALTPLLKTNWKASQDDDSLATVLPLARGHCWPPTGSSTRVAPLRRDRKRRIGILEPVREKVESDELVVIAWSVLLVRRRTDVESRDPPHVRP